MKPSVALNAHREAVRNIAAARKLVNLRVFGSTVHGDDTDTSDLDLLIDESPGLTLFDLMNAEEQMEIMLGVRVEILTPGDLPPKIRATVLLEAVAV
jgi:predicted nucleotidyltransferase